MYKKTVNWLKAEGTVEVKLGKFQVWCYQLWDEEPGQREALGEKSRLLGRGADTEMEPSILQPRGTKFFEELEWV